MSKRTTQKRRSIAGRLFASAEAQPLSLTSLPESMPTIGIGLDEHISFTDVMAQIPMSAETLTTHLFTNNVEKELFEAGPIRIEAMDKTCTAIQVLSWGSRGADLFQGKDSIKFAQDVNNRILAAKKAAPAPERFLCFAHLPVLDPQAAAKEFRRTARLGFVGALISGTQGGRFLDEEFFDPIFACAEKLDLPIYLHPGPPPLVVDNAYFYPTKNLSTEDAFTLSMAGWGWHAEVGLHVLRLAYAGVFERHPKLKIIIGHNGEMLPMMMHHSDTFRKPDQRPISDILRKHVWVSMSGNFTMPAVRTAINTFGLDHICWSVDYPFVKESTTSARPFVRALRDTLGTDDFNALMFKNAAALLKLKL